MNADLIPVENDGSERLDDKESLDFLDRATTWFWWSNATTIILILVAMLFVVIPNWTGVTILGRPQYEQMLLRGLMFLMLILNSYSLYRRRRLKLFREQLYDQIQSSLKHRRRAEQFYGMSMTDPLTELFNRRYGEEKLRGEIARTEEHGLDLAVIAVDLDYFKEINDKFGHAAGDWVLKEFSRNLRKAIRSCDFPIRLGGDEFLVILPECSKENTRLILSRLKPFEVVLNRRRITASYSRGVAQYQVGDTPHSLVQRADKAMYAEKATRSNPPV